jgi:hypothetical protein
MTISSNGAFFKSASTKHAFRLKTFHESSVFSDSSSAPECSTYANFLKPRRICLRQLRYIISISYSEVCRGVVRFHSGSDSRSHSETRTRIRIRRGSTWNICPRAQDGSCSTWNNRRPKSNSRGVHTICRVRRAQQIVTVPRGTE